VRTDGAVVAAGAIVAVALGVSIAASDYPGLAAVAGALALGAASLFALRAALPWLARPGPPPPAPPTDPLTGLRRSLEGGALGRDRIVYAVQSLELSSGILRGPSMSPAEVRALEELPPEEFQDWLGQRLDRLEREV